ncbi:kinase non-catalytic C-lobe domain-containing protein 1 [Rana temporaria]|uniref:kinase non-catalytic C-lobe domain-containing protein 1 n=1 Tax=Rana temporaria TaxID=8407 RepID=UPI001AAD222E|nr:kinase non-catalytic C-lobe domain-containing protein 1 [Rana temporaria]
MRSEDRSEHFQSRCNNRGAGRAAGLVPVLAACARMEEAEEVEVPEYYREEEDEGGEEDGGGGGGGKEFYEFQPLPTLLEDEENVSLADILSLRDNCLTEQDIWAICLECCYSMKDISHAAIFQTLCITPDTLAFNTSGNVCFMEQLSDDPEGAFVPPEFDLTGNTLEAHIYSLGATLKAAIEFVVDPDSQTEFCQDLNLMLDSMQQENPANRPDIESIISQCEEKLGCSSASVCRSISSIGRRVLSIESVSAVQDGWDSLWKEINKKDNSNKEPPISKGMPNHIISVNESFINPNSTSSREGEIQNGWREVELKMDKPCSSPNFFGYHLKKNKREKAKLPSFEKFENFDRVKVEDEMAKLSLKRQRRNKNSTVVIQVDKHALSPSPPNGELVTLKSWPSVPSCLSPNESMDDQDESSNCQGYQSKHVTFDNSCLPLPNNANCLSPLGQSKCHSQVSYENLVMALEQENQHMLCMESKSRSLEKYTESEEMDCQFALLNRTQHKVHQTLISPPLYLDDAGSVSRHVNSPELDEDIDGQEPSALQDEQQWIPLKDILINYGKPLQEDELWTLCHECLCTLKTYIDYPAILCLESVLLSNNGEVLFVTHGNEESYDSFCVPPEYGHDCDETGTEKACVYGIAAILWSTAKFNFPANHKLALPKKLKRFLLQMAKKDSEERPGLDEALQICRKYLLQKNLDSKAIWSHLIGFTEQIMQARPASEISASHVSEPSSGFVPVATNSKLMAVKGPVPLTDLPAAFTSPATYFKPIVIMQNTDVNSNEVVSQKSSPKESVIDKDLVITEEDICVSDMESHRDEDKEGQISKSSSRASRTSHNRHSSLTEYPSDRKENVPSAASSISSNSSTLTNSPIVNNYLLKQDPKTGNLTLVRVHLSIPDHIPSVSLETEPVSQSIKTHNSPASEDSKNKNDSEEYEKYDNAVDILPTSQRILNGNDQEKIQESQPTKSLPVVNGETRKATSTPLQKVIQLLHDEFAFDGYLENGIEDTAMGEYILALKGLQHATFCSAVCEKFCDLYWEDRLLENLYRIINGKSPPPSRKAVIDSSQDNNPAQLLKKIQKKGRKHRKHEKLSTNEQSNIEGDEDKTRAMPTIVEQEAKPLQPPHTTDEETPVMNSLTGSETQVATGTETRTSFDETDMTDFQPQTTEKDQQPQSPRAAAENEEEFMYRVFSDCNSLCVSPDFSEENEDANEFSSVNQRENMSVSPSEVYKCGSGWSSAFYGSELFDPDVQHYVSILGRQKDKCPKSIEPKRLELEQQLMIETKNYRKTIKLYQNLMQKGRRSKGSDAKELLLKLKGHSEEMKSKVQFLELAKKLLQVSYAEQWGVEPRDLPSVADLAGQKSLSSSEDDAFLLIYNDRGHSRDNTSKNLQAGTPLGLLAYLYCRNAVLDGYVQQLLYTFRYFCSQEDLLQFLIDGINNTVPREDTDPGCLTAKIYHRSIILLQTWIEDCWHIDCSVNPDLLDKLEDLSNSQSLPKDERGEHLVSLLHELTNKKYTISSPGSEKKDDTKSLHSLCTKFSEDNLSRKSFNWKLSRGNGLHITHHRDKQYTISAALPRPCYPGFVEDLSTYYVKGEEAGPYSIHECSVQQISTQLTLLQEEMFQKCHPVHFLNSRALGVKDKSSNVARSSFSDSLPADVSSLFSLTSTHKYLLHLLRFADNVSTWVAAEIVTCHTSKLQANILTKFLLVAKLSYEQRDFSTAMQILGGLENLIVRQLPAWKNLPSKVSEILEELKAVEVFLKSDSLCLMKGDRFRTLPTIPSAYLLAMHVQQLETGGFTMANGAFKWNKLRNIAKVISQVHAFQEIPYSFASDQDFQFYLRQRISHFNEADISALAADNNANFHHVNSEKHSRKIQDTLRRMKATFQ